MVSWRNIFTGRERRKHVRLSTELNVDFKLDDEGSEIPFHKGMTRDISPEGICLATGAFSKKKWEEIVQEKRHLSVCIYFPPGYKEDKVKADAEVQRIDVVANVIWQQLEKRDGKDICLLGLYFTRIENNSQEIIRSFIAENLLKRYRPA